MFKAITQNVKTDSVTRYKILDAEQTLSYADVITKWRNDASFRKNFTKLLVSSPFPAFRWETPPLSFDTQLEDFEFVLINTPWFANRQTDENTFAARFLDGDRDAGIVNFKNLSGDATMVVPSPRTRISAYGHLAAFLRGAPPPQVDALWRVVGDVVKLNLNDQPLWLNTAGGGVAWLHVRLDSRPKYYGYQPYKNRYYN